MNKEMKPKPRSEMTYNELLNQIADYESQKEQLESKIYDCQMELQIRRTDVQRKMIKELKTSRRPQYLVKR